MDPAETYSAGPAGPPAPQRPSAARVIPVLLLALLGLLILLLLLAGSQRLTFTRGPLSLTYPSSWQMIPFPEEFHCGALGTECYIHLTDEASSAAIRIISVPFWGSNDHLESLARSSLERGAESVLSQEDRWREIGGLDAYETRATVEGRVGDAQVQVLSRSAFVIYEGRAYVIELLAYSELALRLNEVEFEAVLNSVRFAGVSAPLVSTPAARLPTWAAFVPTETPSPTPTRTPMPTATPRASPTARPTRERTRTAQLPTATPAPWPTFTPLDEWAPLPPLYLNYPGGEVLWYASYAIYGAQIAFVRIPFWGTDALLASTAEYLMADEIEAGGSIEAARWITVDGQRAYEMDVILPVNNRHFTAPNGRYVYVVYDRYLYIFLLTVTNPDRLDRYGAELTTLLDSVHFSSGQ